jgi:hypothetical protein
MQDSCPSSFLLAQPDRPAQRSASRAWSTARERTLSDALIFQNRWYRCPGSAATSTSAPRRANRLDVEAVVAPGGALNRSTDAYVLVKFESCSIRMSPVGGRLGPDASARPAAAG